MRGLICERAAIGDDQGLTNQRQTPQGGMLPTVTKSVFVHREDELPIDNEEKRVKSVKRREFTGENERNKEKARERH